MRQVREEIQSERDIYMVNPLSLLCMDAMRAAYQ